MGIQSFSDTKSILENVFDILTATLSTTEVKVGTGAELDPRLYEASSPTISVDGFARMQWSGNYIVADSLSCVMSRIIVNQSDVPEAVVVTGKFTVVND
ncbi:MAG: hypothetical protein KJP21_04650 [Bacteroidia bacterium]|nr:hypothetical protein [Bacteroidia bacterium]NNJ56442.1 hypothetical protein [Bacteroidia bacterium]